MRFARRDRRAERERGQVERVVLRPILLIEQSDEQSVLLCSPRVLSRSCPGLDLERWWEEAWRWPIRVSWTNLHVP